MSTVKTRATDWTAGEWSDTLGGRVDVDKYGHGAARIENLLLTQGGGLRRRPGTGHRGIAAGKARLIPFIFAQGDAYTIEMSEGLFRFYTSDGRVESAPGVPVQVGHTYFVDELPTVNWTPSADVLLFAHPAHPPSRLERLLTDGQLWRVRDVPLYPPPSYEYGQRPTTAGATLTPSATSGVVTLTASAAIFLVADIGREAVVLAGVNVGARATITAFTDTAHVTATVTEAFTNVTATAAWSWKMTDSPKTTCTPGAKDPVGINTTLTLGGNGWRTGDVGKFVRVHGGTYRITSITSPLIVQADIFSEATAITAAPSNTWSLEEAAFSADNGYPAVVAFAEDRLWYFGTPAQPLTFWASKSGDYYNFAQGVLAADALIGTLNSDQVNAIRWAVPYQRGLMVGTAGDEWSIDAGEGNTLTPDSLAQAVKPATSYGSTAIGRPLKIGNVVLFVTRSRRKLRELAPDPNAITVSYVAPDMTLLADHLTTPVSIMAVKQNRRVVELAWQREPQQTVWAAREDGTLLSLAYIREQNVVGWCRHVLSPTLTLDGDGRQIPAATDGLVESVCVIPHAAGDRDQVWLSVARTVGGALVRHVEVLEEQGTVFDDGFVCDAAVSFDGQVYDRTLTLFAETGTGITFTTDAAFFDAGMVGSEIRHVLSGARATIAAYVSPTSVQADITIPFTGLSPALAPGQWGIAVDFLGGLDHLEGRTAQIVGDGGVYPPQTVVGGAVDLVGGPGAMKIEAGLGSTSRLKTLRPEVAGLGTVQGRPKRNARVVLRVHKSAGFTLSGKVQPFRRGGDPLGTGTLPQSRDIDLADLGWDTDGQLEIEQANPLPLTLLGLFPLLATDD